MTPLRLGVVGIGRAGLARVRAIHDRDDVELVGVHRGRFASQAGVPELDADALIACSDVVVICSPTPTHQDWCARALTAGRHVIVEYPLAMTADDGAALFATARDAGRVLHVEHIELLTPVTTWLVEHVGELRQSQMSFVSKGARDVMAQVSRLHRLVAVGGGIEAVTTSRTGDEIHAVIHMSSGLEVPFSVGTGDRRLSWDLQDDAHHYRVDGRSLWRDDVSIPLERVPLFATDLDVALRRVRDSRQRGYVSEERILGCLQAAQALDSDGTTRISGVRW